VLNHFSQHRAARRAIGTDKLYGRANELVAARGDPRQVDAFKQYDAVIEKGPMDGNLFIRMSGGKIVEADQPNTRIDQRPCSVDGKSRKARVINAFMEQT
jgi:hypothetical protein